MLAKKQAITDDLYGFQSKTTQKGTSREIAENKMEIIIDEENKC